MKVIGIRHVDFTAADGKQVSGYTVFCSYPIARNGQGFGVEKIFLSDNKLANIGYFPELDDEINVSYNRWGKVESVSPVGM